jgi:hypothetical protein
MVIDASKETQYAEPGGRIDPGHLQNRIPLIPEWDD